MAVSFSNASHFVINGSTFVDNSIRNGRDELQLLSQYVAQGATHDSRDQYDAPKCHPGTRKWLHSVIKEWMLEPKKKTGILYLHGPAGAGKSCIARSTCSHPCPPGFIRASFFFWRGSDERNNITKLFTTIAYQLAMQNVYLAGLISDVIQRNPRIVSDASVTCQFRQLILEPFRSLASWTAGKVNGAIIIDGLDECVDKEAQISIIELLAWMVNREGFPLGFVVTSRPELHLKEVWDTEDTTLATQYISLSNIPNASTDIRTVLQSGFSCILNKPRFKSALQAISRPWPDRSDVERLVYRSSGQFIYAATVLKFVSNQSRNPDAQLQIVLAFPACGSDTSPLADLDSLYYGILSRADDPARTIEVLSFLLAIMSIDMLELDIVSRSLVHAINKDMNIQLLMVEQLIPLPRGEAFLALNDLHSLIDLYGSSTFNNFRPISFYHKSFRDFLLTMDRSKDFYVDIKATHAKIVQSCLRLLCLPVYKIAEQHVAWLYSFFIWPVHMDASGRIEDIHNFEQLIQKFIGTQLLISYVHLQDAFKLLKLGERTDLIDISEVLTGFRRLSPSTFNMVKQQLWTLSNPDFNEELFRFKKFSICSPLLVAHFKSYKMDLLTVKRSLAIHDIVPFRTLSVSCLYNTGVIHDLSSLPEIQEDMISCSSLFDKTSFYDIRLLGFLSNRQSSGIFSCSPDDFAEAYSDIINITAPVSSEGREVEYSRLFRTWTRSLQAINPATTPAFLAVLESAARRAHDQPRLNRSLTHKSEIHIMKWLENLPSPPKDIIDAWGKAFFKARCATLEHNVGYSRYFCPPPSPWDGTKCPTRTCPGWR